MLVTEGTIEENLLATLAAKNDLALAAFDVESEVDAVDMASGMEELKGRLEVLLGAASGPVDQTVERQELATVAKPQELAASVAAAGGELLGAAFKLWENWSIKRPPSRHRLNLSAASAKVWAPASTKPKGINHG